MADETGEQEGDQPPHPLLDFGRDIDPLSIRGQIMTTTTPPPLLIVRPIQTFLQPHVSSRPS